MLNGKRIKEAREKMGLAQTTVDCAISAGYGTCKKLEENQGTINPDQLGILCDILHVDRLWLLTDDGKKGPGTLSERVGKYMHRELRKYFHDTGRNIYDVASDLVVSAETLRSYAKSKALPSSRVVERMRELYGIDCESVLLPGERFNIARGGDGIYNSEKRKEDKQPEQAMEDEKQQLTVVSSPKTEEPKPDEVENLKKQLLRMNADMLRLKCRLGEDVTGEYAELVEKLLGGMGC